MAETIYPPSKNMEVLDITDVYNSKTSLFSHHLILLHDSSFVTNKDSDSDTDTPPKWTTNTSWAPKQPLFTHKSTIYATMIPDPDAFLLPDGTWNYPRNLNPTKLNTCSKLKWRILPTEPIWPRYTPEMGLTLSPNFRSSFFAILGPAYQRWACYIDESKREKKGKKGYASRYESAGERMLHEARMFEILLQHQKELKQQQHPEGLWWPKNVAEYLGVFVEKENGLIKGLCFQSGSYGLDLWQIVEREIIKKEADLNDDFDMRPDDYFQLPSELAEWSGLSSWEELCWKDVTAGVKHLHKLGIVHGNICPETIVWDMEDDGAFVLWGLDTALRVGDPIQGRLGSRGWTRRLRGVDDKYAIFEQDEYSLQRLYEFLFPAEGESRWVPSGEKEEHEADGDGWWDEDVSEGSVQGDTEDDGEEDDQDSSADSDKSYSSSMGSVPEKDSHEKDDGWASDQEGRKPYISV